MRHVIATAALCVTGLVATTNAFAGEEEGYTKSDWPLSYVKRPLVLASGMLEIRGETVRVNLSKDVALEPISLAPDVFYGVTKEWTVGITHDTGICLTGTTGGCAKPYNDVGIEAQYSLMGRGSFQLAATGGASAPSFSPDFVAGLNFGFLAKIHAGSIEVRSSPKLYVGVVKRSSQGDSVDIPVDFVYQLQPQTAVALETGFEAALDDLGGANKIPVGLSGLFSINEKFDIGAAFRLGNVAGTDGGIDERELIGRLALRL